MKAAKQAKAAPNESLEKRFRRFAMALMAVPKKELDKELAKHQRKKVQHNERKQARNG